jgi:hypothetical protein
MTRRRAETGAVFLAEQTMKGELPSVTKDDRYSRGRVADYLKATA